MSQTLSLMRSLKRTRLLFRLGSNLLPILQYVVGNVRCVVVGSQILTSFVVIAFLMQPIPISEVLQRIANGQFLLPSVQGLGTIQETRMVDQLNELELLTLMINTNRLSGVVGHLQGILGDLQMVQTQEYGRRRIAEESVSLEVVATQVGERALDVEFGDLSVSRIDAEMEDFGDNVNQEGSA